MGDSRGRRAQVLELALFQGGTADLNHWSANWWPVTSQPIVLRVDDCRKTAAELKARGVPSSAEPKDYPWGISLPSQAPTATSS
ncbi:MAG: hypothetical protein JRN21_01550 [Nitrososphaerota archaeon]|nr:hypothetical protein [Nitrososphaerota archaeon]